MATILGDLRLRGENKDAYDLVYVLLNYGEEPVVEVAERFVSIAEEPEAASALVFLDEDFASMDHIGPKRRAEFLGDRDSDALRADTYGVVRELVERVRAG